MDSQECFFGINDELSIDLSQENGVIGNRNEFGNDTQKENEALNFNINQELGDIPRVDEDLLADQKLSDFEEMHSNLYDQDMAKEIEFQSLFYEKCTQPGKEWVEQTPGGYQSPRSRVASWLESLECEESKFNTLTIKYLVFLVTKINAQFYQNMSENHNFCHVLRLNMLEVFVSIYLSETFD